jgi:hypothetical protein
LISLFDFLITGMVATLNSIAVAIYSSGLSGLADRREGKADLRQFLNSFELHSGAI